MYVIPGGGIEPGESVEQAAIREVKEKTSLDIVIGRKLWIYNNEGHREHYFLATTFSGSLRLGGPELKGQSSENIYQLEWVSLGKLAEIPLLPEFIRDKIVKNLSLS
jgi:8-oxo-dGTP pyrophosphatase MutT (NUDIX family)